MIVHIDVDLNIAFSEGRALTFVVKVIARLQVPHREINMAKLKYRQHL